MSTTHLTPTRTTPSLTRRAAQATAVGVVTSTVFVGATFGFYYAWVCSTMWGLDAADPRVAIAAMQAMNASVRNPVFFPVFFLTPAIALITAGLSWVAGLSRAAALLLGAGILTLFGSVMFTTLLNVPLNEALALVTVPADVENARAIWTEYSTAWQARNITRTVVSGVALTLCALAALAMRRPR